jgi:hypothetical protein
MTNDRNSGRPSLDDVLDALKDIYFLVLEDSEISVPGP